MTTVEWLVEIAGWAGALLILGAYALLSAGRVAGNSWTYQGMNVAGSAGFIVNTAWHGAWPSATLNVVWCIIGVVVLSGLLRRSNGETGR